jgi:carboxymethylenebutenolidase
MYADITKPPAALPEPRPKEIGAGLQLLPPLSRRGHGPGMILLVADSESSLKIDHGVPGTLIKWAEEGYTVVEISSRALAENSHALKEAIEALKSCAECDWDAKVGIVGELSVVFHMRSSD